jgi:mannose-6-phosphate isomerase-like protein (cupin superfamily)
VSSGLEDLSQDQERIARVQASHEYDPATTILTARDAVAVEMMKELSVGSLAEGFKGRFLPIVFGTGTDADVEAPVGATTDMHSHGTNTFHQIQTGTWRLTGRDRSPQELSAGDWAYIPADVEYTLEVVENSASLRYRHF